MRNKMDRQPREWVADYQWARHGTTMPLCGFGCSGTIRVRVVGNEQKARARAIAAICEKHIVSPENVRIITIRMEE